MKKFIDFIHYLIVGIVVLIPFHHIKILKKTIFIPIILYSIWLFFDGCPLTIINKKNDNEPDFIHKILLNFNNNISASFTENFINWYLVLTIYIGFYRLYLDTSISTIPV